MSQDTIQQLTTKLQAGELDRRGFIRGATALGLSGAAAGIMANHAVAQDASPAASPGASPVAAGGTRSITREEYHEQLREYFDLEEPAETGGQIIYVQTTDIRTLHPHLYTDVYSSLISRYVYEFLADGSAIDGTPVPSLADYWEVADDGMTYTFHIAQDAMWHDGEPVTADDVIFSFDSMLAEGSQSIRQSGVALALESYSRIDDKTVQLVSPEPMATFIQDTAALVGIVPMHIWQDVPVEEWGSDPGATGQDPSRTIGSGPFRFVEWVLGDHVTMERNDDYRDPERMPVIDQFTFQVVADPASAQATLQTGESDITEITFANADGLRESNPELDIVNYDTTSMNYYYTNQSEARDGIFTDMRVRQALHFALDHDVIADIVYNGYATRAIGTQPVLSIAFDPDSVETDYIFDPDQANALLDEAGWAVGADGIREQEGTRLSFELLYSEGAATYETQVPYMQQAWLDVGVEMLPTAIPFPTLIEQATAGNFDMAIAGFSWTVDGSQGDMFRCDAAPPNGFNRMNYCNEEYDALDVQQRAELDEDRRIELLQQQSNIVNNEAAVGINVFAQDIMGSSPLVHNFLPNGYEAFWALPYMWIEQG